MHRGDQVYRIGLEKFSWLKKCCHNMYPWKGQSNWWVLLNLSEKADSANLTFKFVIYHQSDWNLKLMFLYFMIRHNLNFHQWHTTFILKGRSWSKIYSQNPVTAKREGGGEGSDLCQDFLVDLTQSKEAFPKRWLNPKSDNFVTIHLVLLETLLKITKCFVLESFFRGH